MYGPSSRLAHSVSFFQAGPQPRRFRGCCSPILKGAAILTPILPTQEKVYSNFVFDPAKPLPFRAFFLETNSLVESQYSWTARPGMQNPAVRPWRHASITLQ